MSVPVENMWGIDVQDEDSFLQFVFEQAPLNSLWCITQALYSPEEQAFIAQLANSKKLHRYSEFEILLTETMKSKLILNIPEITLPIHHSVYTNNEPFMVSYDSFSVSWLSRSVPLSRLNSLLQKGVINLCES